MALPVPDHVPAASRLLLCDAALLEAGPPLEVAAASGLRRARAAGMLVGLIDRRVSASVALPSELRGLVDVSVTPQADELTDRDPPEVRPTFIVRVCADLELTAALAVVLSSQRDLLSAADAAGARGVMVPTASTPAFHVRALPHIAPDVGTAIDTAVAWSRAVGRTA